MTVFRDCARAKSSYARSSCTRLATSARFALVAALVLLARGTYAQAPASPSENGVDELRPAFTSPLPRRLSVDSHWRLAVAFGEGRARGRSQGIVFGVGGDARSRQLHGLPLSISGQGDAVQRRSRSTIAKELSDRLEE